MQNNIFVCWNGQLKIFKRSLVFCAKECSAGDVGELWMECSLSSSDYLRDLAHAEVAVFVHENACEEMTFDLIDEGTH